MSLPILPKSNQLVAQRRRCNGGFTLVEMLIVISIIAVLVSIAIPIFASQVNDAKVSVDQTSVQSAKAVTTTDYLAGKLSGNSTYYYDQASASLLESPTGIVGYGQYGNDDRESEIGASGIPCPEGSAAFLKVQIAADGTSTMSWTNGGGPFSGRQVSSADEWKSLSFEERLERDVLLLDSLQEQIRNMTYGELRDMGASLTKERWGSHTCYKLAQSTILGNPGSPNYGEVAAGKNAIYAIELFESAGYDTSKGNSGSYIVTSIPRYENIFVWVDSGVNLDDMSDEQLSQKATTAFVYVNGGDSADGADILKHEKRSST